MTMARRSSRPRGHDDDAPVFVISVAAELAGMHAQTLRQYDRLGLVTPSRTRGGGRRYSTRDVALLREVQRLSQEGVSLAGIQRILELETHVDALQAQVSELTAALDEARAALASGSAGLRRRGPWARWSRSVRGRGRRGTRRRRLSSSGDLIDSGVDRSHVCKTCRRLEPRGPWIAVDGCPRRLHVIRQSGGRVTPHRPDGDLPVDVLAGPLTEASEPASEMQELFALTDWSATPLGPGARPGPPGCATSSTPACRRVSPCSSAGDLTCCMIYNDGYRTMLGESKHPRAWAASGARGLARGLGRHRTDVRGRPRRRPGDLGRGRDAHRRPIRLHRGGLLHLVVRRHPRRPG